jgi:hypothetical protein
MTHHNHIKTVSKVKDVRECSTIFVVGTIPEKPTPQNHQNLIVKKLERDHIIGYLYRRIQANYYRLKKWQREHWNNIDWTL